MADGHDDIVRYEENYIRDVIFYIADDGSDVDDDADVATVTTTRGRETQVPGDQGVQGDQGDQTEQTATVGTNRNVIKEDKEKGKTGGSATVVDGGDGGSEKEGVCRCEHECRCGLRRNDGVSGGHGMGDTAELNAERVQDGGRAHDDDDRGASGSETTTTTGTTQLTEKEVMEIFEERERRFTEEILSPRCLSPTADTAAYQQPRFRSKTRSRSRSPCTPCYGGVGLEHLDNLVRLLEQLTELKAQNRSLRKKCHYLENTKSLLQVHNVMLKDHGHTSGSPKVRGRSRSTKHSVSRSKVLQHQHVSDGGLLGHYVSDSSDEEDREQTRTKPNKLTQRSQSVGSINVDLVDIDLTLGTTHTSLIHHHHHQRHRISKRSDKHSKDFNRFESMFSKSKISSKWERVKKVFSGKPEASSKSPEPATISAEQLVRANSKYCKPPSSLPQMIPGAFADPVAMLERHVRASTSPTSPTLEPSSPVSVESEPVIPSVIADDQDISEQMLVAGGVDSVVDVDGGSSSCGGGTSPAATSVDDIDFRLLPPPSPSPSSTSSKPPASPPIMADTEQHQQQQQQKSSNFLTVKQTSLRRRQSSPTLCLSDDSDAASAEIRGDSLELPRSPHMKRSSSFKVTKSSETFTDVSDDSSTKSGAAGSKGAAGEGSRKYHSHRSAWGRVKDIIHTRKDSLKRKNKRSNSAGDMLPDAGAGGGSSGAGDGLYDYCSKSDVEEATYDRPDADDVSPRLSRKGSGRSASHHHHPTPSPCASPTPRRAGSSPPSSRVATKKPDSLKSPSGSPPPAPPPAGIPANRGSTSPGPLDVSALMGGMSEEFNKKMQEWEEKKQFRRSLFKENSINLEDETKESSDAARFTEEFIRKMEEWEKMKGLGSPPKTRPSQTQSPDVCTPPDQMAAPPSMEDLQKHLSESFSKTVQEWERIKTQRIKETGSPVPDTTTIRPCDKRSRKQERSKSRERDRSRSKYDKQRERERQKIEKKEQKIEKERQKLEKMRQKLEGIQTMSEAVGEGVSQEFARKLYEWEVMKGLRQEHSGVTPGTADDNATTTGPPNENGGKASSDTLTQTTHTRSQSAKAYKEYFSEKRERTQSESQVDDLGTGNATLSERRKSEVGTARSASVPSVRASSRQLVDDSTSIDLSLTNQDTQSAEERTGALLADLSSKEEELSAMQHEMQQLTERISAMDIEHNTQIENYKRELWASSQVGRYTIETDLVQASIYDLRQKVDHLIAYQGKLVNERNHLQHQLEVELRARQTVEARLVTQVRASPAKSSQHQQAVESVKDFDKLCEFFLKLWSQLNELRLGILERNKLLVDMQQHVLQQEVGNRLLAADMASRDLQLAYLQGMRRRRVLRRSHTFAGRDHMTRGDGDTKVWSKQHQSTNYHTIFRRAIDQLRHGDIEATPVDWEWLERLRAQRASAIGQLQCAAAMTTHEAQTESLSSDLSSSSTDTSAQTTMTMCYIPDLSPSSLLTPPIVLENKGIQADLHGDITTTLQPAPPTPMATSTPVKNATPSPGAAKCSITGGSVGPCRPQLVRQKRAESPLTPPNMTSKSTQSPTSACSSASKANSAEAVFTFNVADSANAGLVGVSSSSQQETAGSPNQLSPTTWRSQGLQRSPESSEGSGREDTLAPTGGGPWVRRCCVGGDQGDEPLSPSLYPPPSPIIRSRNTRKLKADVKSSQLYSDGRTLKATPPKRIRHRRTSTEKRPESEDGESAESSGGTGTLPSRARGRSEGISLPQPRSLSVPPKDSIMYDLCFRDRHTVTYGTKEQRASCAVSDMISKFENGATSAPINCCRGNRSPSPAIRKPLHSPMHRLKTAAELMEDSGQRRGLRSSSQTRASSISPIPLSSSDKENDKSESKVLTIVQRLSREGTPGSSVKGAVGGRPMSPTGELIRQTVRRLSESSCDVKPALMDLTNGGSRSSAMSDSFAADRRWSPDRANLLGQSSSPSRSVPAGKVKRHELPKDGQVSKFTSVYESKVEDQEVIVVEAKPRMTTPMLGEIPRNPMCDSIKSIDSDIQPENDNSDNKSEPPSVPGKNTLERRQKMTAQPSPSSSLSRDLKSKFFGRKTPKGATGGSAIGALCKQALVVDVQGGGEGPSTTPNVSSEQPGKGGESSPEKPGRTRRFLDTNWLQKPKRFFKVSKC